MDKHPGFIKNAPKSDQQSDELAPTNMDPFSAALRKKRQKMAQKRGLEMDLENLNSLGQPQPAKEDDGL